MISGLPAPCPVAFLSRRALPGSSTLSMAATSPTLKYQSRSSIFFCVTSKSRSLPVTCAASAFAVAGSAVCASAGIESRKGSSAVNTLLMGPMLHCALQDIWGFLMRAALTVFILLFAAGSALAVDLGKAEGTLVIDNAKFDLRYAYAIRHHKNQLTNRADNTLIILSDKPLPDDANLHDFEASLPDGVNGVMVCIDKDSRITHVAIQHPSGMFDAGFFE